METLADRMTLVLKELNVKQYEMAKQVGISANYLNLIVKGKRGSISLSLAKLIQELFGYSAVWLLEGTGKKMIGNRPTPKPQQKPKQPALRVNLEKIIDAMTPREIEIVSMYARFVCSQRKKKKK
jgi:transcriptional regulator with XRE-family HTH domain